MKVKDLIEQLSKLDPEMEVLQRHGYECGDEEYSGGENFPFRTQRMVEVHKYKDDKLVDIEYEPYVNFKEKLSLEDSEEYLILNSENDEVEDES